MMLHPPFPVPCPYSTALLVNSPPKHTHLPLHPLARGHATHSAAGCQDKGYFECKLITPGAWAVGVCRREAHGHADLAQAGSSWGLSSDKWDCSQGDVLGVAYDQVSLSQAGRRVQWGGGGSVARGLGLKVALGGDFRPSLSIFSRSLVSRRPFVEPCIL
jgi:hypothetical protein